MDYEKINPGHAVYDFESFIPTPSNPVPYARIMDFITVGPFVLQTNGSFEAEHMYERDKILLEDYLAPDGGERRVCPKLGCKVKNNYFGEEYLAWDKGFIKWNSLRFDKEGDACDPALYATEQRNAVYYAAFYVDCKKAEKAVIYYENSGSSLFVNGEPVDFKPFGRVKGLHDLGYQCPVCFKAGRNLVMFKLRGGYIADTMDISISACCVLPVINEANGTGIALPLPTASFVGTEKKPRMVYHIFAAAFRNTKKAVLSLDGIEYDIPAMKKGECHTIHAGILSGKERKIRKCRSVLSSGGSCKNADVYFDTIPYDGYNGNEHVFSDFHFDTTYHQEQRTYALGAFHITKCITDNLIENPDFKAVLSEIDYLHPYYSLYPHHREAIRKAFEEGRAEADCFYNQPNDLTSSGEAFVRNMAYGQLYHRNVLGRLSRVYVPGDVFGHFSQISQVCAKGGCDMVKWGKAVLGLDSLFRHISPDGTVIIHDKGISRADAARFCVKGCNPSSEAVNYVEAFPRTGNTEWMKDTIHHVKFSVFSDLADDINGSFAENEAGGRKGLIDLTSRDLTQHHSGVLLTRTDFKQANRLCENLLVTGEKFAAVAFAYGAKYPEKALDKAWRQLLCAQHHDSITGTNNEISFVDLMAEYRECAETACEVLKNAAEYIAARVRTSCKRNALFVFNPIASAVSDVCAFTLPEGFKAEYAVAVDLSGKEYPLHIEGRKARFVTGKIPATGYTMYRLEARKKSADSVTAGRDNIIENAFFRLTVSKVHGGIISLYDKKNRKEFIDLTEPASGNAIYALREIHDRMETQHELYTTGEKLVSDETAADIRSEKCTSYQKLIITNVMGTLAKVIREITLFKGADTVDFRTIIEDYNSEDDMFCATFPMNIRGGAVIYDDRFAPHVATRSKKYMSFQTHQYASFSGCRVLPSNRWFGIGPSVTLSLKNGCINAGMTALIRKNNCITREAGEKLIAALAKKGIPVTPYSDTEQHGGFKIINFNEDIYSTDTRFVLSVTGDGNTYADKLISSFTSAMNKRFENALASKGLACAYFQDSDNAYGKPVDVFLIAAESGEKLNEYIGGIEAALAEGYCVDMSECIEASHPAKAENYGAAIINNGNISCSVEGKSTLNLMLFHTASFYGNMGKVTGKNEMVPEDKTHVFTYRLYPHAKSFREADVYGRASRFNERLFAVSPAEISKEAFLPEKKSFLECSEGFEITAFKAGGYPMASMRDETKSPTERGLTVRGYDVTGTAHKVKITTSLGTENVISTNLLEENGTPVNSSRTSFAFEAGAHSIETFCFAPTVERSCEYAILGREKDITEPTYVRSWEHDMGSVATGYLRFAATLNKKAENIDAVTTRISLNAVNNSADMPADVIIDIVCSKGIRSSKKSVHVMLAPGESSVTEFDTVKKNKDIEGQVKIYYTYDGQSFTDVFEFGYFNPDVSLDIDGNKIVCTVTNPTDQKLEGSLIPATPFETWGNIEGNINAYGTVEPSAYHVELEPHGKADYIFTTDFDDEGYFKAYYAAVKLCCNGRIHFAYADRHGPRHNVWAHEFINEINRDNGSIKKLIEM